jgi:acetyl-CoA acetyltransferase
MHTTVALQAATETGGAGAGATPAPKPDDIVIVSACRTALTKASKGGFKDTAPDELLTAVLKETLRRTGVKPEVGAGPAGPAGQHAFAAGCCPAAMSWLGREGVAVDSNLLWRLCWAGVDCV